MYMRQQYCDSDIRPCVLPVALWMHLVTVLLVVALCWTDMTTVLGKVRCTAVVIVIGFIVSLILLENVMERIVSSFSLRSLSSVSINKCLKQMYVNGL
jgi:predicted membrane channel-forming protein YqfA (hemolysin III family)